MAPPPLNGIQKRLQTPDQPGDRITTRPDKTLYQPLRKVLRRNDRQQQPAQPLPTPAWWEQFMKIAPPALKG